MILFIKMIIKKHVEWYFGAVVVCLVIFTGWKLWNGVVTTEIIVFFSLSVLVCLGVFIYFFGRYLKGSIVILLPKTKYYDDEVINGSFELRTKKAVMGNELYVALVGEKYISYNGNGGRWQKVSETKVVLEENKLYNSNFRNNYNFAVNIPKVKDWGGVASKLKEVENVVNDSMGKFALNKFGSLLNEDKGFEKVKWSLVVVLDAEGIDLKKVKDLEIKFVSGEKVDVLEKVNLMNS